MKQDLEKIIADFEAETGRKLEIRDGRPYYSGALDLKDCTGITSLPEGLTVGGSSTSRIAQASPHYPRA